MSRHFIERSLAGILRAMEHASSAERIAGSRGLLQPVDARVKLTGFLALIAAAAVSRDVMTLAVLFVSAVVVAVLSCVPWGVLLRAWAAVGLFSSVIVLPAVFVTPGESVGRIAGLDVSLQGLRSAAFLMSRVEVTTTLALLLVTSTPWPALIAALRSMRVPAAVVLVVAMTYRYVFVLLRAAEEMFVARRSRTMGMLVPAERRRIATATAGVLLGRSLALADDVYLAMRARGFRGEVVLLEEFRMRARDRVAAIVFAAAFTAALWSGLR